MSFERTWYLPGGGLRGGPTHPSTTQATGTSCATSRPIRRAAFGNIDPDPAAMEDLLCDSELGTTAAHAPSRQGTSGPVRRPYEA